MNAKATSVKITERTAKALTTIKKNTGIPKQAAMEQGVGMLLVSLKKKGLVGK